jgi:nucleolar GTP-binding protein
VKEGEPLKIRPLYGDVDEILERAFQSASRAAEKETVSGLKPIVKARIKEKTRLRIASKHLLRYLNKVKASIPRRDEISSFYAELLESMGAGKLDEANRAVARASNKVHAITRRSISEIDRARSPESLHSIRRAAYGRISTEVRSLRPMMEYLERVGPRMKELPTIQDDLPTIVIAGYPNVGKTTLLKALTGSSPEIKPIPFTTQKIQLGYFDQGWRRVQVVDTPGLLDRPLEERNPIEMKAIAAIGHLAGVVVFLMDPTTSCGFILEDQVALLEGVRSSLGSPVIVAINKVDIATPEEVSAARSSISKELAVFEVSSTIPAGVEELRAAIWSDLRERDAHGEG